MKKQRIVVTFGTFDLFHVGHLRMLLRTKTFGDKLVVGVSSDQLNFQKKIDIPNLIKMSAWKSLK